MLKHALTIDKKVHDKVPSLYVECIEIENITVTRTPERLIELKKQFLEDWKGKTVEDINGLDTFKAYRTIHEQIDAYPDNVPPAVENLYFRGVLKGRIPTINNIVDSCNLVSVRNQIPVGVFDGDGIAGNIVMRLSEEGDQFIPIGKSKASPVPVGVPILVDDEKVFSIPGVRDSNETKITKHSKNLFVFSWGNKDIPNESVQKVLQEVTKLTTSDT